MRLEYWFTDRTKNLNFKVQPLSGSSYIKLLNELNHSRKGLINIQNSDDNKRFKWCLVTYLNPANHHPARIRKTDKDFAKKLTLKTWSLLSKLEIFTK